MWRWVYRLIQNSLNWSLNKSVGSDYCKAVLSMDHKKYFKDHRNATCNLTFITLFVYLSLSCTETLLSWNWLLNEFFFIILDYFLIHIRIEPCLQCRHTDPCMWMQPRQAKISIKIKCNQSKVMGKQLRPRHHTVFLSLPQTLKCAVKQSLRKWPSLCQWQIYYTV